jgi:hypothetical protein
LTSFPYNLLREGGVWVREGDSAPLSRISSPLLNKGRGIIGGEVDAGNSKLLLELAKSRFSAIVGIYFWWEGLLFNSRLWWYLEADDKMKRNGIGILGEKLARAFL